MYDELNWYTRKPGHNPHGSLEPPRCKLCDQALDIDALKRVNDKDSPGYERGYKKGLLEGYKQRKREEEEEKYGL